MKRVISVSVLLTVFSICLVTGVYAATVDGHVFKDGQTDHSGITINLEQGTFTPTLGGMGLLFLLAGMTLFMFRKKSRAVVGPMVICLVAGISCVVYAGYLATTVTNSAGEYDFTDVEPGDYSIDASAVGYNPAHIPRFTVTDGANTAPDITLYPIATGDLISTDAIVGNMRYVPAGTFTQGSPETELCRFLTETQFDHTLTRNLAVMETEVTRQMWADLLSAQPSLPADPSDTGVSSTLAHPVQQNTWFESVLFANLLSMQNGYTPCYYRDSGFTDVVDSGDYINNDHYCDFDADGYRLATEGEWEYFCRAGTTMAFSCNETNYTSGNCGICISGGLYATLEQYCWCCTNPENVGTTQIVGNLLANPWNLKDVHGNVWEWCWDWYGMYPVGPETDYEGASSGSERVRRGGAWISSAQKCRSAHRNDHPPGNRNIYLGFRLLRTTY